MRRFFDWLRRLFSRTYPQFDSTAPNYDHFTREAVDRAEWDKRIREVRRFFAQRPRPWRAWRGCR